MARSIQQHLFDSRQLHDQAENNYPERGFCFYGDLLKACFQKGYMKTKNHAQHGSCFLFAELKLREGRTK